MTTFVLRLAAPDGTYAVAAMDMPAGTDLETATAAAIDELEDGYVLERITNPETGESGELQFVTTRKSAAKGFGR